MKNYAEHNLQKLEDIELGDPDLGLLHEDEPSEEELEAIEEDELDDDDDVDDEL